MLPCVIHEDEHLLVINKPAGLNTHAPSPYAGEGLYEWLRHREPRWAALAIIHRLDKETSGVLVFSKTTLANRSLTAQFTAREVQKRYLLLTDRAVKQREQSMRTALTRVGDRYVSRPLHAGGETAETKFRVIAKKDAHTRLEAEPLTGRTHQIRVHAAEAGFPILGDSLYGGSPHARVCLHAAEIRFQHPASTEQVAFKAPVDFESDPRMELRRSMIEPELSNAFRAIHGASDGWPGWYADQLGDCLLSQAEGGITASQLSKLRLLADQSGVKAFAHKTLQRHVQRATVQEASPQILQGTAPEENFLARENGVRFELSFQEGYSVGLFLDQRENRRRLLTGYVAAGFQLFPPEVGRSQSRTSEVKAADKPEVLNAFAYTCGFSVCAALGGARVTSLDLSRKYLDWGKRNFACNGLDPAGHDFIYGDYFDWAKRLAKKGRQFDVVLLDPPTFSQSKESGVFRAQKDFGRLVTAALPLLKLSGVLFCSTNAADWPPEEFLSCVDAAIASSGRRVTARHYVPQPLDFPVSRNEPAYLKTVWLRLGGG